MNPRPLPGEIGRFYPREYYSFKRWGEKKGLRRIIRLMKWKLLSKIPLTRLSGVPAYKKGGRILDFGCGSGEVLQILKSIGWKTAGVEVDREAAVYARSQGLEVYDQDIKSIPFPDDFFDVVRLRSVLEHLHEPHHILEEAHRILKPDGTLLIIVPNIKSFSSRLFKERWYHLDVPRHFYQFSFSSMRELLRRHSFRILSSRTVGSGGFLGSLDYWINEKKGRSGTRLYKKRILRLLVFFLFEAWLNLLKSGDLIEARAQKES
jgi:SAM-dependent methyltransferase